MVFALSVLIISFLVYKKSRIIASIFLITICIFHISNMEYINALNSVINMRDLHYLTDMDFLKGSFSEINFPVYTITLLLLALLFLISLNYTLHEKLYIFPKKKHIIITLLFCVGVQLIILPAGWQKTNFEYLSIINSLKKTVSANVPTNTN